MKKIIIILLIIAAGAGGYYYYTTTKVKLPLLWQTQKAEKGDININVTATGTLNAVTTVQVGTQVSGTIAKLYVDFNSVVKKGQVIAELDPTYLKASLEDVSANLQRAEIQMKQAKREFDRIKILHEEKVVAQMEYDQALAAYETAVSAHRSVQAQYSRSLINLKFATITAPINGVVISRTVDIGQTVAASFNTPTLFTIAQDMTKMQVQASIDEADIGQVQDGQKVNFTVDAYPDETFIGIVSQKRLQPIVEQNVVTYIVIIDVPNKDLKLMPGMTANITVAIHDFKDVVRIPNKALRFTPPEDYLEARRKLREADTTAEGKGEGKRGRGKRGGGKGKKDKKLTPGSKTRIWVRDSKDTTIVKSQRVVLGHTDGSYTAIEEGLEPGQEVVIGFTDPNAKETKTENKNPFAPQPMGGGGGRRRGGM